MSEDNKIYEVIPLGLLPECREITINISVDTLESVWEIYNNREDKLESFDSLLNRLVDEAIYNIEETQQKDILSHRRAYLR